VIRKILKDAGVSRKVRTNLINGVFTPVNFSKKRFETKVNTIESELNKLATEDRQFSLNEEFVYPREELKEVIEDYRGKEFFTEDYDPETYDYKLDKDGRIIFDSEGDPVKKDRTLIDRIPPAIKEGFQKLISPFEGNITTGSLPNTPMPNPNLFAKAPVNTNLTRTESALLSDPLEREIARRT